MRYLVTGGAGFIGFHLSRTLLQNGHDVLCIDNLSTGQASNLAALSDFSAFTFIRQDVTEPFFCDADAIFNLACPASPVHYQRTPVDTLKTAVIGTLNALELARQQSIPMLQASTSEVYGDPAVHPQHEGYQGSVSITGPRACYDEGKRCAETLCFDFQRQYQVDVKVARIFNTYGPGMAPDDGRVIMNLINQALADEPLTLYGDGQQTRSFCYVDDLVAGLIKLLGLTQQISEPVNLGNPEELRIIDLANHILKLTNSRSELTFSPLPVDDPHQRCPDIALAETLLGWTPRIPLQQGLLRVIQSIRNR